MFMVNDIVPGLTRKLGNRTDLLTADSNGNTPAYVYISQAVQELTDSYQFHELRVTGPLLALTTGVNTYSKYFWTNGGEAWTDVNQFFLQLDSTSGIGWRLDYRDIAIIQPMSVISGIPVFWSQQGDSIVLAFKPQSSYNTQMFYQKKHPFSNPVNKLDRIYMPDVWAEVVEVAAALRGAIEKRASDYIQFYSSILNGDEEYNRSGGKYGKPGMIFGRISQEQRNKTHNSRQLAPTVMRY